jgi:hypothetical protein
MEATKAKADRLFQSINYATFKVLLNLPFCNINTIREDLKTAGITGTLKYSGSRHQSKFILQTTLDATVPETLKVQNRTYAIKPFKERIRTALATIYNIPFGFNPLVAEWVNQLGNVVELNLQDPASDLTTGRGKVTFSHIYFSEAFEPAKAILSIPNQPPVFIRFADYVMKEKEFFLADEPSRVGIIARRALDKVKALCTLKTYANVVRSSPPAPNNTPKNPQQTPPKDKSKPSESPLKENTPPPKKPTKRSREALNISPSSRSPNAKKPLIEEIKSTILLPDAVVKINPIPISIPSDIFPTQSISFSPSSKPQSLKKPKQAGHIKS